MSAPFAFRPQQVINGLSQQELAIHRAFYPMAQFVQTK